MLFWSGTTATWPLEKDDNESEVNAADESEVDAAVAYDTAESEDCDRVSESVDNKSDSGKSNHQGLQHLDCYKTNNIFI